MSRTVIMPGELFIVEYVDGGYTNRWAVNKSKDYITIEEGRQATAGITDVLVQTEDADLIDSRYHITGNVSGVEFLANAGKFEQEFATIPLQVMDVENDTDIYNSSGNLIGMMPAGSKVGIESGTAGSSMRHLCTANAYYNGTEWRFLNEQTYSYGFFNVLQGFSSQMYSTEERSIETAYSVVENDINWLHVSSVIDTDEPEMYLRGDLTNEVKTDIIQKIKDHFASKDLDNIQLGDPVQYFGDPDISNFVHKALSVPYPDEATKFINEVDHFLNS